MMAIATNHHSSLLPQKSVDIAMMWWGKVLFEWHKWVNQLIPYVEHWIQKYSREPRQRSMRLIPLMSENIAIPRLTDGEIKDIESDIPSVIGDMRRMYAHLCLHSKHTDRRDAHNYVWEFSDEVACCKCGLMGIKGNKMGIR